jgi:hypothetical protein
MKIEEMNEQTRLQKIARVIESVDDRCMAYDGSIGLTKEEITTKELKEIYALARGDSEYLK